MKIIIKLSDYEFLNGDVIIPKYFRMAYKEMTRYVNVYALMIFHWLVWAWYYRGWLLVDSWIIYFRWGVFRRPGYYMRPKILQGKIKASCL